MVVSSSQCGCLLLLADDTREGFPSAISDVLIPSPAEVSATIPASHTHKRVLHTVVPQQVQTEATSTVLPVVLVGVAVLDPVCVDVVCGSSYPHVTEHRVLSWHDVILV